VQKSARQTKAVSKGASTAATHLHKHAGHYELQRVQPAPRRRCVALLVDGYEAHDGGHVAGHAGVDQKPWWVGWLVSWWCGWWQVVVWCGEVVGLVASADASQCRIINQHHPTPPLQSSPPHNRRRALTPPLSHPHHPLTRQPRAAPAAACTACPTQTSSLPPGTPSPPPPTRTPSCL